MHARHPALVIVGGLPATGKSALASRIAQDFHLPFFQKDGFKEILFDTLGWEDRAWSQKLSTASNALLLYSAGVVLANGQDVLVESNFHPGADAARLQALTEAHGARTLQIYCRAEPEVLWQRFVDRAGQRHPGHTDALYLEEFRQLLQAPPPLALELGGELLEVDTTDFVGIDYARLREAVWAALSPERSSR